MKTLKADILIFLSILGLALVVILATFGQSAIDIQLHDTYFVFDKLSLTVLIIGPLTFLIFFARGLTRRFKTKATNTGLMIGLILVALITYQIIQLHESYLSEVLRSDSEEHSDKTRFAVQGKRTIRWTWGIFCLWTVGLSLLMWRTIRISKNDFTSHQK